MKKNLLSILTMMLILAGLSAGAQTLVSTDPLPKNAVLEEFTGIHCQYCPDGHAIAAAILENNPGRAVVIGVHQGSFAVPGAGEPDYRTAYGDALASQAGVNSYPAGTVNRHVFIGSMTGMGRGDWTSSANAIMQEMSPVNVGISSEYDAGTRELTVHVELYYTEDEGQPSNFITVALLQDHIFGPQTGGGQGNNYEHMHMLREFITGQWGDEVTTTTAGSFVDRTYTYTIPEDYNSIPVVVENCQVAVFVAESHQEILSGDVVDAIGGTNKYIGNVVVADDYNIQAGTAGLDNNFNLQAKSSIEGTEDFTFTLASENAPADWNASFKINGETYTGTATISLEKDVLTDINLLVTPGDTPALAEYTMTMAAVNYPEAPVKVSMIRDIAGITDLVVNGTGGPESVENEDVYLDGLMAAGCTGYTSTNADIFTSGVTAGALSDVHNVYLNIAWTFPALTLDQIAATEAFMDNGGNLLIAGQDIGWDFMSGQSGSHGSPEATTFYNDYLFSNFVDDGSTANNQLIADPLDEIYGETPTSAVVDVYGGNMYPEQISAREGGMQVFYYDAAMTKAAVVRALTANHAVVYFGIGLEMISDVSVKNQIISLTRDWFDGLVGTDEYDAALTKLNIGQNYPNPASLSTSIPVQNLESRGEFLLMDMNGQVVRNINVSQGSTNVKVDLSGLSAGTYFYHFVVNNKTSQARKLIIK